ncbi:unnamed protein product [Mytilus coruscus]|uniref:Uncharacterized protein n=1 Tax=Mytilus coruscus TaxID=42192 RepID=A0A6J8F2S0_MYTCO|nr:unnamed protein product [Mytilus coruscus]
MNACQAILKPDCSKPKVLKSTGIQKAIIQLTAKSLCMLDGHLQEEIHDNGVIKIAENVLPDSMRSEVKLATVEFAGVKFKAKVFSGDDYLDFVKNYVIQKTINQMPNISRMVICEEKYHFTPDDFKAATRAQRTSSANVGISHLKTVDEMISANRFDKASLVSTAEGKSFISTYLARRIDELHLYMDLTLIIDSEFYKEDGYTTPVECLLGKKEGLKSKTKMVNIKQRKGEAEMAKLDWLLEVADKLEQGDGCASIVTSGDIDALVIHLFTLSFLWPRSQDGTFKNDVYVVLQKAGSLMDIYNITKIIEILEKAWKEKYVAAKVAIALSLGGNDFLPKFHNITHSKTLDVFLQQKFRKSLINVEIIGSAPTVKFNNAIYVDFVKTLYCSKKEKTEQLSFEEVRKITMKYPSSNKEGKLKNPQLWMPPASALLKLATNVQCLIDYYLTAGYHNKYLPDFISRGCLKKTEAGEIEFDLGEE